MYETIVKMLIIDDNPEIFNDFKKILTLSHKTSSNKENLDSITSQLFGGSVDSGAKSYDYPKFEIDYANQGLDGVSMIETAFKSKQPYILAFVDIKMPPGIDGIETIKRIWNIDPDIQIVICTAFSDYSWEETVQNLGAKDNLLIIKKPFDTTSVRQMTCALSKKWHLLKSHYELELSLENKVAQKTKSLNKSLSITRATLESSSEGIVVVDDDEVIMDFNKSFCDIFEIDISKLYKLNIDALVKVITQTIHDSSKQTLKDIFKNQKKYFTKKTEITLINDKHIECYISPYKINGKKSGTIFNFRDLTDRINLEKELKHQASHDNLTGALNRMAIVSKIDNIINNYKDDNHTFHVLFLDLDSFKAINDNFGHGYGDTVLQHVANKISINCSENDCFGRLGGDEFIIVKYNLGRNFDKFMSTFINSLNDNLIINGNMLSVHASIGVSVYPHDGNKSALLIKKADLAMYSAKEKGGNQYELYSIKHEIFADKIFKQEQLIVQAFRNNEFILFYQPQINIADGSITSVEALIRWKAQDGTIIDAGNFIPLIEHNPIISEIGKWVLEEACLQNKKWHDYGLPKIKVAVNVSKLQIIQNDFVDSVKAALIKSNLAPKYLEIELSENIIVENSKIINIIKELEIIGVSVSFDDFGTGNTGLANLVKIPVNQLKIDKSFVQNMHTNKTDLAIIKAILQLAVDLKLDIIAEGVENKSQVDFLCDLGCRNMQGYFFSKAMNADDVYKYLDNYNTQALNNNQSKSS